MILVQPRGPLHAMASVYDRCFALTGRPESTSGIADVAGHGLGRLNWVDSCPPRALGNGRSRREGDIADHELGGRG